MGNLSPAAKKTNRGFYSEANSPEPELDVELPNTNLGGRLAYHGTEI
jgi:hypothetical protein